VAYRAIFDSLTFIDEQGRLRPALATGWKQSSETTLEVTLRSGVRFSNGEPFTAEAVKFSIERIFKPEFLSTVRGRIPFIKSVDAVSPTVVKIETTRPDVLLPRRLAAVFIVPPRYVQQVGDQGFLSAPIGTGPFRVAEFVRLDHLTLVAVDTSWRGIPKPGQVTIRSIPDPAARVAALLSGSVDVAQNLPMDTLRMLQADRRFRAELVVQGRGYHIQFRTRGRPSVVADKRIRQAFNYAVNKETIAKQLLGGAVPVLGQLVGPSCVGHDPSIQPYPFDPTKAKQLLQSAGYQGQLVTLDHTVGSYTADKEIAETVASYLRSVGVNVETRAREFSVNIALTARGEAEAMIFNPFNCFPLMDGDFVLNWYASDHSTNLYGNPEFDKLLALSRTQFDPAKRLRTLYEIARITHDDPPAIFLFEEPVLFGLSRQVTGFTPRADFIIWFDTMSK